MFFKKNTFFWILQLIFLTLAKSPNFPFVVTIHSFKLQRTELVLHSLQGSVSRLPSSFLLILPVFLSALEVKVSEEITCK